MATATKAWLRVFLVATVMLFAAAVAVALSGPADVLSLVLALGAAWALGWHLAWQLGRLDIDDPDVCLVLFRSNRNAGLLAVGFLLLASLT